MVWWCPSGSSSVRPTLRPSVRVSVRLFSALFSYMLWHIELKFCAWLCFNVLQIKFECRHFASIFERVMPLCELKIWEMCSFPHFSLTCVDILSWNFAYDFVLMYYRSSSSVALLRQFLKELCLFLNLEYIVYMKYTVFRSFLLHVLTYWAEILHMTLFYCTTDQVRVSSLCVNFWKSYASLWTKNIGNVQFSTLFSYMRWHIELKFCIWLCFNVLQITFECRPFASIFEGVMPLFELRIYETQFSAVFSYMLWHVELKYCTWLCFNVLQIKFECHQFPSIFVGLELRILEILSFPHFSLTCFDIMSWNFAYDFVLLYYRSSSSVVNLRQFL